MVLQELERVNKVLFFLVGDSCIPSQLKYSELSIPVFMDDLQIVTEEDSS